jgi:hypothetical protein
MKAIYIRSFKEGFFGSFKLALALVLGIVAIGSAFIDGGGDAAMDAARNLRNIHQA